jgi:hypothetical protein
MSRRTKKAPVERRKTPRKVKVKATQASESSSSSSFVSTEPLSCKACEKKLLAEDRALFVEEELGRVFCSEDCIADYFQPEITQLEKEYLRLRPKSDLTAEERESVAHYRWMTLQEPEEIWLQEIEGDKRYTFISSFEHGGERLWCIAITLCLRGEPSFLFIAFPTRSEALVEAFRKGEQIDEIPKGSELPIGQEAQNTPYLTQDIDSFLEPTLQSPDELWKIRSGDDGEPDLYHFIKFFQTAEGPAWFILIAEDNGDSTSDQVEIKEYFLTSDPKVVEEHRKGSLELDSLEESSSNGKMVH